MARWITTPGYLTLSFSYPDTEITVPAVKQWRLIDLPLGASATVDAVDLPEDDARRLMELGFLPGAEVIYARRSPFGDPRVFRVDDSEIALRRETARHIVLRPKP
jgi:ferrous iron transport protein A